MKVSGKYVFLSLFVFTLTQISFIPAVNDLDWGQDDYFDFNEEIEEEIECDPPPSLTNGETDVWGDGLLLEYRCKDGYFPVGITHGACDLSIGKWTIDPPVCVDQGCPPLTTPRHGVVNVDTSGGLATLVCRPGYFLLGDSTLVCDKGRWKGIYPMCVAIAKRNEKTKSRKIQRLKKAMRTNSSTGLTFEQSDESCFFHQISPPQIENAVVDTSYLFNEVRHRYVMVATYTCMGGFILLNRGANMLFCKNKVWAADETPRCITEDDPCEMDNAGCHHYCTPQGSNRYSCSCYEGYNLGSDAKKCQDVDECAIDNGGCEQECFNTDGSFFCSCHLGYTPKGPACIDIDECLKSENQCPGPCINTPGSFKCDCNVTGFTASGSPDYCNDIDECAENNGGCDNVCVNRRGFYQCRCEIKGRQLSDDGHSCIDIDECERYNLKVCSNGRCVNNEGSYICKCKEGYKSAMNDSVCEDIDECLKDNGGCSHICSNAAGSFSCSCHEGYFVHDDTFGCVDIDECSSKNGGCEDTCKNTIGSFLCSCEMDGKILSSDGRTCAACASNQYYDNSLSQCVDCPPFSKVNTKNAREVNDCQCLDGFDQSDVKDDLSFECLDRDECLLHEFRCAFKCINTPGSAHCICPKGFILASDKQSCEDIDDCQSINDCAHICENTNGSYICHCNSGFSLEADGITCTDIQECDVDPALCSHTCVNTMGSYRCECDDGFVLGKNGMNCEDIDECADENPRCEHKCINTDGSYRCECDGKGFKLSKDHSSCIDINECMEGDNPCPDICINTIGSFLCDCNSTGYLLGPDQTNCIDVDECKRDPNPCQNNVCINTPGSYICKCRKGFDHPSRNNLTMCIPCEIGFYRGKKDKRCVRCPPKSTTPKVGSTSKDQCECMPGFKGNPHAGGTCVDVNECADKLIRCEHGCVNTNGSAHCICRPGFHLHLDGFSCTDINECLMLNGGCDQKCVNSPGSYHCECQSDFTLAENGRSCEDVNECASPNHGCEYRCVNKRGGAMCTCPPGYDLLRDGKKCHDRDECRIRNGGCTDTCINTPGSYHCECNIQGYELYTDGRSCIDVDECLKKDTCDDICVNVVGSFRCYCRRHGYKLAYDKRSCEDVDECARGRICQQRCINIQGSFRCDCNAGYYKQGHHCTPCSKGQYRSIKDSVVSCLFCPDGMTTERAGSSSVRACHCQEGYHGNPETRDKCQDIDECARNNGGCEQVCENTVGSFKCSCSKGYALDPKTKKCKATRCPLLNPPRYGRFITPACFKMARGRHVKPGISCVIKCRNLLVLSGAKERTCLANFTWSQPDTKCNAFPCQRLPVPKNGFLHPPSCLLPRVPFRARCSFRCNNGFIRVGRPAAKCRANQRWSGIGRWGKCIPYTNSTITTNHKKS